MSSFVGIDGCKAGWIAVSEVDGELRYGIFGTINELLTAHQEATRICIDIPIGFQPFRTHNTWSVMY
ncbi:DUF429 domain-containing protein [Roseateles albus]|uniref:DUF429 domain-containing protein n=1 Tax=Roseateles albus TaxID=2987525 RepID=UPI003964830A